jgi:hypothetical protein
MTEVRSVFRLVIFWSTMPHMRWIRLHIRHGAWLALTALAIHFVLTFGHVHAEQFSPVPMGTASVAATNAQAGGSGGVVDAPQPYRPFLSHDHLCAVCASISLLASSVLPEAGMLPLPRAVIAVRQGDVCCTAPPRRLRSSAKARAPPSA